MNILLMDSMRLLSPKPDIFRGPLFFAGEGLADHEHGFQCVEGAMCSGLHAARSLIDLWDRTMLNGWVAPEGEWRPKGNDVVSTPLHGSLFLFCWSQSLLNPEALQGG